MSDKKLTGEKFDNHRLTKFLPFISPNPVTSCNPVQRYLKIDKTSFISLFSSVKGDASLSSAKCCYSCDWFKYKSSRGSHFT